MHDHSPTPVPSVAYFSAEYAIADDLPIYAGGLGILAADTVFEAARQQRPFWAVGLVYHESFTGDDLDQRPMTERLSSNGFELAMTEQGERQTITVIIQGRPVTLQAWKKTWGATMLILLDARLPQNDLADQQISDHLYASDPRLGFAQEICLGIGGVAMLEALGYQPDVFHLNEGHAALAGLAAVLNHRRGSRQPFADTAASLRPRIAGTKHTILSGAGVFLDWLTVEQVLGDYLVAHRLSLRELKTFAAREDGDYSGTKLMLSLAGRQSGVSRLHTVQERQLHPQSQLIPITNGVFPDRWMSGLWGDNPLTATDTKLWAMHRENRRQLLEHVQEQTGKQLDGDILTVVWARRMAAYKRPELIVSDLVRLAAVLNHPRRPVQLIVAGQANPADIRGAALMTQVIEASRRPELTARLAYLPHYNPMSAKYLVRGADLWLNTPVRGYEACGTSGMKASLNGALQLSTSDGWVDEVNLADIGWELPGGRGPDGSGAPDALYRLLEEAVAPLFYEQTSHGVPLKWVAKMRANIQLIYDRFTAERMLNEYYAKLYERA